MLRNGPFWMLAGAVLVLFFLPLGPFWSGPFWFAWAVFDLHWGRFGDGPFWSGPHVQGVTLWKWLNFGVDPDPDVDLGSVFHFHQHQEMGILYDILSLSRA